MPESPSTPSATGSESGTGTDTGTDTGVELITRRDQDRRWNRPTGQQHVFQIRGRIVHWLEIEDVLFHHNSAVMMPDRLDGTDDQDQISGLDVIAAGLIHARANPDQKLLIVGHTDTSGDKPYNVTLSELRGDNVLAVLVGDRDRWAEVARDKHKVEDYQQILTWIAQTKGWPCDPSGVDNNHGTNTTNAIIAFKCQYKNAPFGEDIGSSGTVDLATWKAFFTMYMERLKGILQTDDADLRQLRAALTWLNDAQRRVGCGEYHPVEQPGRDGFRSQENRRVELVFFDPGEEPRMDCHAGNTCQPTQCELYDGTTYDFHYITPTPLPIATLEIVTDDSNAHAVDANSPVATLVRIGVWDNAFDGAGDVQNTLAEATNFVGADTRRFYFRVRDTAAVGSEVTINWKTLRASRADDDAPASQALTLLETAAGSKVFVSKAVMLVTDDTDRDQVTNSGLPAAHADAGDRDNGQSNHRTRRAELDGFIRGEYTPTGGGAVVSVELPIFDRCPDERRRLNARVINYSIGGVSSSNAAYISGQFTHANDRWNQVGLQIDRAATVVRPCPAGALNAANLYAGVGNNAAEQAALSDLIPITPDNTVTIVFVRKTGGNAYATLNPRNPIPQPGAAPALTLGNRWFVFLNDALNLNGDTLAHEFHHVIFNRGDTNVPRQFFSFNTNPSNSFGIPLPDVRIRRRIHNLHTSDPDNDPNNDNVLNWYRRARGDRHPVASPGTAAPTATTGNTLVGAFLTQNERPP